MEKSQRFSSGVALTFAARLLMAANSVIAGILVARLLGTESLGIYLILSTIVQVLIHFSSFGLYFANTYFVARSPEKLIPIAVNSTLFAVVSGGLCVSFVLVFVRELLPGIPYEPAFVGLISVPFQVITIYVLNLFLAKGDMTTFVLVDLANQSIVMVSAVVVLLIVGGGVQLLISVNTGAAIVMTIVAAVVFFRSASARFVGVKWRMDAGLIVPMMRYSLKGFVLWASTLLVYRLDLLIINYFRGAAEAGVYAVATQCTLFLLMLPHVISHLLQAHVAAMQDEGGDFTCRVARNTSLLLFTACLLSVPGALLVAAVYGPGFSDLPVQLWILLPGVYLMGVQLVISQYFMGTGIPVFLPIAWLTTLALNIAVNLAVVPIYGARGAAIASAVCYAGISFAVFTLFKIKMNHSLRSMLVPTAAEIKSIPTILFRRKLSDHG